MTCERQYAFRYYKGLRLAGDKPWRMIGTLMHSALAYHYGQMCPNVPDWLERLRDRKMSMRDVIEEEGKGNPQAVSLILDQVFPAYLRRYAGEPMSPIFVEEEFVATLGEIDPRPDRPLRELDDEVITCRTDLVSLTNGASVIVDHKCTSGDKGYDRLLPFPMDGGQYRLGLQVIQNLLILGVRLPERGYPAPQEFLINQIKRKAPFDFQRGSTKTSMLTLNEARTAIREYVARELEIRDKLTAGRKALPNFAACHTPWGPCDYADVCGAQSEVERRFAMRAFSA